jgi:hypothetical protein
MAAAAINAQHGGNRSLFADDAGRRSLSSIPIVERCHISIVKPSRTPSLDLGQERGRTPDWQSGG